MKSVRLFIVDLLAFVLLLSPFALADKTSKTKPKSKETASQSVQKDGTQPQPESAKTPEDDPAFKALNWRLVGPFRGGRALAVSGVVGEPNTYYFGAVAGGVWKTTDGGLSWQNVSDKAKISSVGAIAVSESDPNVIYVGSGEACIRGNILAGEGVYKSIDAGKTWTNVGLKDTRHIGRLVVHPKNPDIAFVAALGHAYGTNQERGVFRTTDGGKTWTKVLYKDEKTGAIDLSFDPSNPNIIFAALWEANRTPYGFTSGGPGSGIYRSSDGGTTWKQLKGNGLPSGVMGRIGVAVSASPNRVWALIEAEKGGLYRSDDGGENWQLINPDRRFQQRAWYYTHIFADPKSPDTVYILNTGSYRSIDGGKTFAQLSTPHGDNHGLWIDPTNPKRLINSNDGGADISTNGGESWTSQDNQPTAQFYHVITDNQFPYRIYGAQQDNTTVSIPSRTDHFGIDRTDWYPVGGGESGYIAPDPQNPNIVFAGSYGGLITRLDHSTGQEMVVNPWPINPIGAAASELKYRFQWTAPIVISPNDPNVIYHGAQVLFKSTDKGMSWTQISPDLTRNDRSKQGSAGGPITQDNTSVEYYDTIYTIAESPKQKDTIWVGSDDGLIHVTQNGGQNWSNVTPKGMPEWSRISLIEASPFDAGTAYAAVELHELDDLAPYVYKTTDLGKSWSRINSDLPATAFVHAVREDPKKRGLLYAATEEGVFVSFDDGGHWKSLQRNLPRSSMRDIVVHDNDLIVATHGRAFWVLDDIAPLREYAAENASRDAILFKPSVAYRFFGGGGIPGLRGGAAIGQNPPNGALIYYQLKTALKSEKPQQEAAAPAPGEQPQNPELKSEQPGRAPGQPSTKEPRVAANAAKRDEITLDILDSSGKLVRHYPPKPEGEGEGQGGGDEGEGRGRNRAARLTGDAGLNRFVWDLHYEPPTRVPGVVLWAGQPEGPVAVPGTYTVKLTVHGQSYTAPLEVKADPRLKVSQADLQKQFDLITQINQEVDRVDATINEIRDVRKQIDDFNKHLGKDDKAKTVADAGKKIEDKMKPIEDVLTQSKSKAGQDPLNYGIRIDNQLIALAQAVGSADSAPTKSSYDVFNMLKQQSDDQLAKWRSVTSTDIVAYNQMVRQQEVPVIVLKPSEGAANTAAGGGEDKEEQDRK